jgi:hypothetical protein
LPDAETADVDAGGAADFVDAAEIESPEGERLGVVPPSISPEGSSSLPTTQAIRTSWTVTRLSPRGLRSVSK